MNDASGFEGVLSPHRRRRVSRAAWVFSLASLLAPCLFAAANHPLRESRRDSSWGTPFALGFHYPGISARLSYGHAALEGLYLRQAGVSAAGPRLYCLVNPGSRVVFNMGGEYAWVHGDTDLQKYKGRALTAFAGMEFFAARRTSVGLDMGVSRVSLNGADRASASQVTPVANIAVNFYL